MNKEWEIADFNELKGKVICKIEGLEKDNNTVAIICTDGIKYRMQHYQDCCEDVFIADVIGDVSDLIGSEVLLADEISAPENMGRLCEYASYTWTFYKLATIKGSVDIRWYGTSNGHYSEGVDFEKFV
jgi:hypothetical protein